MMRRIWYIIGLIAVLLVFAVLVRGRQEFEPVSSPTPSPEAVLTAPAPTPTPTAPKRRARATPKVPVPTYTEVAQQYAGRRIEFDAYCAVLPVENVFTDGAEVLLDNRSPDDRVVSIGGIEHGLRGYGWKVVTMTSSVLPVTWAIDCGTAKNVGKIVVEPLPTPTPTATPEPLPTPASPSEPFISPSPSPEPTS